MRHLSITKKISGLILLTALSQQAFADCAVTLDPNGTGGQDVVCSAADIDGYAGTVNGDNITVPVGATVGNVGNTIITTGDGEDTITVSGGSITNGLDGIHADGGNDSIVVNSGNITVTADAIEGNAGNDSITINGGTIYGDSDGVRGGSDNDTIIINGGSITGNVNQGVEGDSGNDIIIVNGGTIVGGDDGIAGDSGNDTITINGGSITGPTNAAITGGSGNDIITLAGDATITGGIDGGGNTDTLSFTMAVPAESMAALEAALDAADPLGGTININGRTYTWLNFEAITHNFRLLQPVPTLQQWALFLLMGLLGLFGFTYSRRNNLN